MSSTARHGTTAALHPPGPLAGLTRTARIVLVVLAAALAITTVQAIAAPDEAKAATTAEGYTLTTPSGGKTFAGNQTVKVNGVEFTGPCIVPGLPGPRPINAPVPVVTELDRFGGNFDAAARILNNPDYFDGKGAKAAAIRWAALNRLLDGAAGRAYNRDYASHYAPQLAKRSADIPALVQRLIDESRTALPANTWRYDSVSLTPEQKARQTLASSGLSILVKTVCPPECVAQGLTTAKGSNRTRDTYLVRFVDKRTGGELNRWQLRPGQSFAAIPRHPDGTVVQASIEKWTSKGWSPRHVFATFEIVCPTPPKVITTTETCCGRTLLTIGVTNTTRRTAEYGIRVGERTWHGTLAPGKHFYAIDLPITAPTNYSGETLVFGTNGQRTGVKNKASGTVNPGQATPVTKQNLVAAIPAPTAYGLAS